MKPAEPQVVIFGGAGFIGSNVAHSYPEARRAISLQESVESYAG
jgi:nucleoside-diphosphate-sugar epimerase